MIECIGQGCGGSDGGPRLERAFLAEGTEYGTVCRHPASLHDETTASTCLLVNYAWKGQCWVDRARAGKALDAQSHELGVTFPSVPRMYRNVMLPGSHRSASQEPLARLHSALLVLFFVVFGLYTTYQ